MFEKQGKVAVYLLKGRQKPLATFAVQTGNARAQRADGLFQIKLFRRQ